VSGRDDQAREQTTPQEGSILPESRLQLTEHEFDVIELAALRGRAHEMAALVEQLGMRLPALGRVTVSGGQIAVCFRPERWLLLTPPAIAGAAEWHAACTGLGVAIDLSCGLSTLQLAGPGPAIRAALARGCRLDLDPQVFPVGHTAATIIAQVSVVLASLADGMLLLTPSTTARHVREWLGEHMT